MTRVNRQATVRVIDLLDVRPGDHILEIGFGPGVGIQRLAGFVSGGHVSGIDSSPEMVRQAAARNADPIKEGRVDLRHGSAESLPFADETFHKALAINSMQVWPDSRSGLREIQRVLKSGGNLALGFTRYSGQSKGGIAEALTAAGFVKTQIVEWEDAFCAIGLKPQLAP